MKPQKSSKKFNLIVAIFVLLIGISLGGYLVLKSKIGTASISEQLSQILEKNKEPIKGCQPDPSDKNKDSDHDGLMDWQEVAWQTDPCRADTDGDGYLDGEEVFSGYDPTRPAPDDRMSGQDPNKPRSLPQNLTEALAANLTKRVTDQGLDSISGVLDSADLTTSDRLVNTAIQETIILAMEGFSLPNIPDEEIVISDDNSIEAVQAYAGKIVETIEKWEVNALLIPELTAEDESETQVIYQAIETNDFSQIDQYITFYQGAAEGIRKIAVPANFKNIHKEQIGIFQLMANIFKAVRQINQDPLRTNLALEQYEAVSNMLDQMFLKLADLLGQY